MLFSVLKQALAEMGKFSRKHHPPRGVNRWFKWLSPGLLVKRWLLLSAIGVLLTSLGLAIWVKLTPIHRLIDFISSLLETLAKIIPSHVSGPIAIIFGILFIFWGQTRTVGSIAEVLKPENDQELIDVLLAHRRLNRGPKIVAIGGGTGLSTLLRGLKQFSAILLLL